MKKNKTILLTISAFLAISSISYAAQPNAAVVKVLERLKKYNEAIKIDDGDVLINNQCGKTLFQKGTVIHIKPLAGPTKGCPTAKVMLSKGVSVWKWPKSCKFPKSSPGKMLKNAYMFMPDGTTATEAMITKPNVRIDCDHSGTFGTCACRFGADLNHRVRK